MENPAEIINGSGSNITTKELSGGGSISGVEQGDNLGRKPVSGFISVTPRQAKNFRGWTRTKISAISYRSCRQGESARTG
jgi:hypothetical protein